VCSAGTSFPKKLVNQLLEAVGLDWDSQVSFKKLMDMIKLVPAASAFMRYDTDSSGSLTREEVKVIAKQLQDSEIAHKGRKTRATLKLAVSCHPGPPSVC
jgi:Ca2+-binding EF-hand superfamily protein